ncbi:MAG TPA: signal peptidase II [Dehalococcoidia bacterium]
MLEPGSVAESPPRIDPPLSSRIASRWRRDVVFFLIAVLVIAADQFTKWLIRSNLGLYETWPADSTGFFRLIHVTNSGAAFGILQGQTPFLIVTSLLGLVAILMYYVYPPMDHGIIRIALGMQLGGAIGNLIDRVRLGEVTDFVDVGSFPTFNIADASITMSIIAVLTFFLFQENGGGQDRQHRQLDAGSTSTGDD